MENNNFYFRYILISLLSAAAIPGILFYKTIESYLPIYLFIIVSHSLYTFLILSISSIRTHYRLTTLLLMVMLLAVNEIVLSVFSIPISYTFFLYDHAAFRELLPYVGSELAFGIVISLFVLIGRRSVVVAALLFSLGYLSPSNPHPTEKTEEGTQPLRVAIIQSVLPQRVTSYPGISGGLAYWEQQLTAALDAAGRENVEIAILPESSMPGFHPGITPTVSKILNAADGYRLITHHYVDEENGGISSQARLWEEDHTIGFVHEKQYPLPIAERLIVPGQASSFHHKGIYLAPFICSESLHVYTTRYRLAENDVGIILTNEAEIKNTYLPELHFISDRIRAKEMGKPLLRASNLRLSAYINAQGEVVSKSNEYEWQNLYSNVYLNTDSIFSETFVYQHLSLFALSILLLACHRKSVSFYPSYTIYILLLSCMIRVQVTYGYEHTSSSQAGQTSGFYLDDYFPLRQLGVTDEDDMEQVIPYIDSSHMSIDDVPLSRGVGVVNTIHGQLYITERSGELFTTLSDKGFSNINKKRLDAISLSDVLWYAYRIEN